MKAGSCLEWVDLDPESTVDRAIMEREHQAAIERLEEEDSLPGYENPRKPAGTRVPLGELPFVERLR